MKKLLVLMLIIATICNYTVYGFAAERSADTNEEEVTIDTFINTFSEELRDSHNNQSALRIQYNENENKMYLVGELDPVTKYWRENMDRYLKKYPGLTFKTTLNIDFKVNENQWASEYRTVKFDEYGCPITIEPISCTTSSFAISQYDSSVNIMFIDLEQYNAETDTHKLLTSIIQKQNDKNILDCSNDTLYIKVDAEHHIQFDGNSVVIGFFGESISSYTNGVSDAVVSLPVPAFINTTFNPETLILYLDISQQTEIINLLNFGHNIMLQLQYQLNDDKPSPIYYAEINNNKAAIKLPIQTDVKLTDILKCSVAYYDPKNPAEPTDALWANFVPQYTTSDSIEDTPAAQIPCQTPITTPTSTTQTAPNVNTTHKCGLCGICPAQPLNICLWMWGCMSVAAIAIVACVISIIVDLKKKKS